MTTQDAISYPDSLVKWYGHNGSVRVAFEPHEGHGCPDFLPTPLYHRLMEWADAWVQGADVPRIVLLVGGPGNGKTTLVERIVKQVDTGAALDGRLVAALRTECGAKKRLAGARLGDITGCPANLASRKLWLVQEGSSSTGEDRPGATLVAELRAALEDGSVTYLCCANRGILVDAQVECTGQADPGAVGRLLDEVMAAVSVRASVPAACWPLVGHAQVAVWPMDAESLLTEGDGGPAADLFKAALDATRWTGCAQCPAGGSCPIRQNVRDLQQPKNLSQLLQLLRHAELASGKRLTFRDIRSLVPAILLGPGSVDRSGDDLCGEMRSHSEAVDGNDARRRIAGLVHLTRHRYHHAIFSSLPSFADEVRLARGIEAASVAKLNVARTFQELGRPPAQGRRAAVEDTIQGVVSEAVDPARWGLGGDQLQDGTSRDELEVVASRGVSELLRTKAARSLWGRERELLRHLADCEETLSEKSLSPRLQDAVRAARTLTGSLRRCGFVLFIRAISMKESLWGNESQLTEYADIPEDPTKLTRVRKSLADLLNNAADGNDFVFSLRAAICQPAFEPADDIRLRMQRVMVGARAPRTSTSGPRQELAFLEIDHRRQDGPGAGTSVALTFTLYQQIGQLRKGVRPECLPPDVQALIDSLKARIGGRRCRDHDLLGDTATTLDIGNGLTTLPFDESGNPQRDGAA